MHPTHVKLHLNSNEIKKWFPDSLAFRSQYQCLADDFFPWSLVRLNAIYCELLNLQWQKQEQTLVAMVGATFGYCE